jgi:hypothetical protein
MIIEMQPMCDLGETSFLQAVHMLGSVPFHEVTLYAPLTQRETARQLQGKFGFELHLVPAIILKTKVAWCIWFQGRMVWSPGVTY